MSKKTAFWLIPLLIFCALVPFISDIDLAVSRKIYAAGSGSFYSNPLLDKVFQFGLRPAQGTCGIMGILFLLTYKYPNLKKYRKTALALCLSMVIGSGTIAMAFKETWGRPRPKQLVEFGGKQEFRPFYIPNFNPPEPSKSFPSGHVTCGFYFAIFYFVGRRTKNNLMEYGGLTLTIGLGLLLSATRLVQGGHFVSDILVAALLMWESAIFSDWLVFERLSKKLE